MSIKETLPDDEGYSEGPHYQNHKLVERSFWIHLNFGEYQLYFLLLTSMLCTQVLAEIYS